MTELSRQRSRAAADLLLELAGPDMYRGNAFRVTGLATTVSAREVRQRRQVSLAAAELGATSHIGDATLPPPGPVSERELRHAFDVLHDAEKRLVHELFWWWGEDLACGCSAATHELHDLAVAAHAKALDVEAGLLPGKADTLWVDAADSWLDALDLDDFWAHVRHRARVLGDRRIDESTVDGLAEVMARALLAPQIELARQDDEPARLAVLVDEWDLDPALIDDALEALATPTYDAAKKLLKEVQELLDGGDPVTAASRALAELAVAAEELQRLLPHVRFQRSATLRNQVAVTLNNCALAVYRHRSHRDLTPRLLQRAADLAVDPADREAILANERGLDSLGPVGLSDYSPPPVVTAPTWALNVALSLAFVAAVVFAGVVWHELAIWKAMIATVVCAPVQLYPAYNMRYRTALWTRTAGRIALPLAIGAIGYAATFDLAAVLWCFGAYVVALPVTCALANLANGRHL